MSSCFLLPEANSDNLAFRFLTCPNAPPVEKAKEQPKASQSKDPSQMEVMYVKNSQQKNRSFKGQGGRDNSLPRGNNNEYRNRGYAYQGFNQQRQNNNEPRPNKFQNRGYPNQGPYQPRQNNNEPRSNNNEIRPNNFQGRSIQCYYCGKVGNIQKNCWNRPSIGYNNDAKNGQRNN